jgi:hypothetical protein
MNGNGRLARPPAASPKEEHTPHPRCRHVKTGPAEMAGPVGSPGRATDLAAPWRSCGPRRGRAPLSPGGP